MLHCEFEGTTISNLQPILIIGGVLAGMALTAGSGAIAAAGAAAVAAAAASFLLFLLLLAFLTRLASGHGDPEDAGTPAAGLSPVANRDGSMANSTWDQRFTVVAVSGRWVYDYGHSRGWNEIHPVKYISKITDETIDAQRIAAGLLPLRPRTDADVQARISLYCEGITSPPFPSGARTLTAVHPSLINSQFVVGRN
jgi:hypothetical protein